jgi:hypothetical protein
MRAALLAIILGTTLALGVLASASASVAAAPATDATAASFAGTRVKVQLVTLGAVLVLVVGVGSAAYFVRKKLGLDVPASGDEPPPTQH